MKTVSKVLLATLISANCAMAVAAEVEATETPVAAEATAQEAVIVSEVAASAVVATEEVTK